MRFILLLILLALIPVFLMTGFLLPYSYITLSILVASVAGIGITHKKASNKYWLVFVALLALILRNIYTLRTGFTVEPLYDGYQEIVTASLFNEVGRSVVIDKFIFDYTTSFPAFKLLTVMLSHVTELSILKSALILPSVWSLVMILFFYLFTRAVLKSLPIDESLKSLTTKLSLLLFIISPDAIYCSMIYYMRHYNITLIFIVIYILFSGMVNSRWEYRLILTILFLTISFSYSLFPYMLIVFIAMIALFSRIAMSFSKEKSLKFYAPDLNICLLGLVGLALVNLFYVHENVLTSSKGLLWSLINFLQLQLREPIMQTQLHASYLIPPPLQTPLNFLVNIRDAVIYIPAFIGSLVFLYKFRRNSPMGLFMVVALLALLVQHLVFAEGMRLASQTSLIFSLYFVIFLSGFAYAYGLNVVRKNARVILKATIISLVVLATVIAFLSPWSHRFLTRHYYDPNITFREVGDHNPSYVHIINYLPLMSEWKYIFTDDPQVTSLLIDPSPENQLRILHFSELSEYVDSLNSGRVYIFEFLGFNLQLGPYGWDPKDLKVLTKVAESPKLIPNFNKVLSLKDITLYTN